MTWGPFLERPTKLPDPVSYPVSPRVFREAPVIFDFVNFSSNLPGNLREVVTPRKVTRKTQMLQNWTKSGSLKSFDADADADADDRVD